MRPVNYHLSDGDRHWVSALRSIQLSFSPATDRREGPTADFLSKKQFGRFGRKFNVLGKKGKLSVKIVVIG
jgi:hypothetical protein